MQRSPPTTALSPSLRISWIFACGALSSRALGWHTDHALALVAAWLVADAALGYVFRQLLGLKDDVPPAPADEAPGYVLLRGALRPAQRAVAVSALTCSGLVLALATYVGREPLLVAATTLFVGALLTLLAGQDRAFLARSLGGLHVCAAWLLGHAALAPLDMGTLGLALVVSLATYARSLLSARPGGARWVLRWAWAVLLFASIQGRQPLVTAAVAVGALAELMNQGLSAGRGASGWAHIQQRVAWLAATALAALASTRWGG